MDRNTLLKEYIERFYNERVRKRMAKGPLRNTIDSIYLVKLI